MACITRGVWGHVVSSGWLRPVLRLRERLLPAGGAEGARPEAEPRLPPHPGTLLFLEVAQLLSRFPQRVTFRNRGRRAQRSPAQTPAQTVAAPRAACVPAGAVGAAGAVPAARMGTGSRPWALHAACCPVSLWPRQGPHPPRAGPAQAQKAVRPAFALLCFCFNVCYPFHLFWLCCVFLAAQAFL